MTKRTQPYGLWSSAISPKLIGDSLKFTDVMWDTTSKTVIWAERRGKQTVLVARAEGETMRDLIDSRYSPSGRVGYGGGAFTVNDGVVYFVDSGRLYRLSLDGGLPEAITPQFGGAASPSVSPDGGWVAFVHTYEHNDVLAVVDAQGHQWPQKLASGDDFVMQPAWSSDSQKIAYIAWNHPQMPWNGTELRLISLSYEGGSPHAVSEETLAGDTETAVAQPQFSPDGRYLAYTSDASGWNHLYLYHLEDGTHQQITSGDIEHDIPHWIQGNHTYGWTVDSQQIRYLRHTNGVYSIWSYDLTTEQHQAIELGDYTDFAQLSIAPNPSGDLAVIGSGSTTPHRILTYTDDNLRVVRRSTTEAIDDGQLSAVEPLSWEGHDGETAHGLFYPPKNDDFDGIGQPPLMVLIHGGPTSQRSARFDMEVQFFTSRGFAVLQVNHRGSTGYGKDYMNKHHTNWGVYDVQDSITGAQYLVDEGRADGDKVIIMGGSAGGYTALQALVDEPGFFKAAVVSYGVANQFSLVMDTHKFEERYSEWLLGALPDAAAKYRDRSPVLHADKIEDAIIIFQGTDDEVVPQNQSDTIVAALQRGGVPHEYVVYEGEGHGFRDPKNVVDFYEQVIQFLKQYVIYS